MTSVETHLTGLLNVVTSTIGVSTLLSAEDVDADIDAILDGFRLQNVRRYFHQVYWWDETQAAARANIVEPGLKLENVAAHSWHVADVALLLADRFHDVNPDRVLRLAILHDKLEMFTGDFDPVGSKGDGTDTHAFNAIAQSHKLSLERAALSQYLLGLRPSARATQRALIEENLQGSSRDAKFVKAIDKLQALAFVHEKKRGQISDEHIAFSLRYTRRAVEFFPDISGHYLCLASRFLRRVAEYRGVALGVLLEGLSESVSTASNIEGADVGN